MIIAIIFSDGFQVFQNENSDKCRPDLDFHCIFRSSNEGFDVKQLLDISKKISICHLCLYNSAMVEAAQEKLLEIISMVCLFSLSQIATLLNFFGYFSWIKDLRVLFLRLLGCFELLLVEVLVPKVSNFRFSFMSYYEENTFVVPNREHWKSL